jgi:hypothetical protein
MKLQLVRQDLHLDRADSKWRNVEATVRKRGHPHEQALYPYEGGVEATEADETQKVEGEI